MARILFVDDDDDLLSLLRHAAERHAFTVLSADDGTAGRDLAVAERPDLIVLDVNMPGMDGRDVCRDLKARDETRDIPILFLSARGDQFDRHVCLELGAEDYLEKPVDLDALMRRAAYVLRKQTSDE